MTLEVAKHAAVFQGLGSILSQPSPELARGKLFAEVCVFLYAVICHFQIKLLNN